MGDLIRDGAVVVDEQPIVTLEDFLAGDKSSGVLLAADEEVEEIASHLKKIPVVALDFPAFSDGRAYSSASILRRHHRYKGEIRAVGDVRIDQLEQMIRCGFNAFHLADGQDTELALSKLAGFSFSYQHTIDREPLFRRR